MRARLAKGVLNISIEVLTSDDPQAPLRHDAALSAMSLAELLERFAMPATFAIGEPAGGELMSYLVSAAAGHEIALVGERSWFTADVGRGRLARELAVRLAELRASGVEATTIVSSGEPLVEHQDVAARSGLRAIRDPRVALARAAGQPQPLRFGLWSLPVNLRLPSRRWFAGKARAARAGIERAIDDRGVFGLAIDASQLGRGGGWRIVERVLKHAARRRSDGALDVLTLGDAAVRLSTPAASRPTRSILRPAA